jgi:hypothetical protein
MLDSFESRLTDMLADGLPAPTSLVVRPRDDVPDLLLAPPQPVLIVVRVLSAEVNHLLGDDALERLGQRGSYQLRPVLYLTGEAVLDFKIAPPAPGGDALLPRQNLLQVLDQALVLLHQDKVRQGQAFQTGSDVGFDLDGFRLTQLGPLPDEPENVRALRAVYHYSGRFWPVETPAEGDIIDRLPTRMAVLPIQIPEGVTAKAGGVDVRVSLAADLRPLNGAPVRLTARLRGASPPGTLIGDSSGIPSGFVAYDPDEGGVFHLVYRPPATLSHDTQVRVALGLAHAERATVQLGELTLRVVR